MQPEQRAAKPEAAFEAQDRLWVPHTVHGPSGGQRRKVEVRADDSYASVDDVADGVVVFDLSAWPQLDREGRLHWESDPVEFVAPLVEVQQIVDAARTADRITGADRPIRVGDVFLIRGISTEQPSLAAASLVVDVSAAARDAAKAALYGAAASTLDRRDAERLQVTGGYEPAAPEAGYFDVRQNSTTGDPDGEASS